MIGLNLSINLKTDQWNGNTVFTERCSVNLLGIAYLSVHENCRLHVWMGDCLGKAFKIERSRSFFSLAAIGNLLWLCAFCIFLQSRNKYNSEIIQLCIFIQKHQITLWDRESCSCCVFNSDGCKLQKYFCCSSSWLLVGFWCVPSKLMMHLVNIYDYQYYFLILQKKMVVFLQPGVSCHLWCILSTFVRSLLNFAKFAFFFS